jgi:GTP cyclohydrolase I
LYQQLDVLKNLGRLPDGTISDRSITLECHMPPDSSGKHDFEQKMYLHRRKVSEAQLKKFEGYASEIFTALGLDVETPSTHETPRRFIQALFDATNGYDGDPKVMKAFPTECRGEPDCRLSQIIEGPVHFYALCEHHVFPFFGQAYVGYIAHEHIIGISKLTRLVRMFTRRFSVQERIGVQIADTLEAMLQPGGVAVYLEARHMCVEMRGVREHGPLTRTTTWRGLFASDPALRQEFLTVCGLPHAGSAG